MEFKNGIIVFTIPKDELFSDPDIISQIEKVQGFLKLKVPIDSQEYPFMVLRKGVATQKVFEHELQHFYNSTLQAIPKDDNVFSYMGKLLADETIAQSIDGSYGNEFSDFLIGFSQGLSIDSMH